MGYRVVSVRKKRGRILSVLLAIIVLIGILTAGVHFGVRLLLYPMKYDDLVKRYAQEYGLQESLVYAVINSESSFDPDAYSKAGAMGLMQLTPETFQWLQTKTGEKLDDNRLYEPDVAVKYGCLLLKLNLDEFSNIPAAIAAYHAGRTRVAGWLTDERYSSDGHILKNIPYKETAKYVDSVIKKQKRYQELYQLL